MNKFESNLTIISITYKPEVRLTLLQIISIDRLFLHEDIEEYLIVINGDYLEISEYINKNLEDRISNTLFNKIKLIDSNNIQDFDNENMSGSVSQQILKLKIASLVKTPYYLLLDAKNFFIREASKSDFFSKNFKIKTNFSNTINPYWYDYIIGSHNTLGLDSEIDRILPTITPYVMDTDLVLKLINELESKFTRGLIDVFRHQKNKVTEFYLYYAYLKKYNLIDNYIQGEVLCHTFFTIWPQDQKVCLDLLEDAKINKDILLLGIHKNRIAQLTKPQWDIISEIVHNELLLDWEVIEWFFCIN